MRRKSCRASLAKHNARRRRKTSSSSPLKATGTAAAAIAAAAAAAAATASSAASAATGYCLGTWASPDSSPPRQLHAAAHAPPHLPPAAPSPELPQQPAAQEQLLQPTTAFASLPWSIGSARDLLQQRGPAGESLGPGEPSGDRHPCGPRLPAQESAFARLVSAAVAAAERQLQGGEELLQQGQPPQPQPEQQVDQQDRQSWRTQTPRAPGPLDCCPETRQGGPAWPPGPKVAVQTGGPAHGWQAAGREASPTMADEPPGQGANQRIVPGPRSAFKRFRPSLPEQQEEQHNLHALPVMPWPAAQASHQGLSLEVGDPCLFRGMRMSGSLLGPL
jgi:hypothetical protein